MALVPGGASRPLTVESRGEFALAYARSILVTTVMSGFEAFAKGFSAAIPDVGMVRDLLTPKELENAVEGNAFSDLQPLRRLAHYEGFTPDSLPVRWLWEVVGEMNPEQQKALLMFFTGSDRVPAAGLHAINMVVMRSGPDSDALPTAHTCFSYLMLPDYSSKDKLRTKLFSAIEHSRGFGLR